jgi:hypothetical protein
VGDYYRILLGHKDALDLLGAPALQTILAICKGCLRSGCARSRPGGFERAALQKYSSGALPFVAEGLKFLRDEVRVTPVRSRD